MERLLSPRNIITVLVIIIFALVVHVVMRQPSPSEEVVITSTKEQELKISKLNQELLLWKNTAKSLEKSNSQLVLQVDSLAKLKKKVKIEYREVYTNISTASNNELDSLIRANW